jgi:hypothetical protein
LAALRQARLGNSVVDYWNVGFWHIAAADRVAGRVRLRVHAGRGLAKA